MSKLTLYALPLFSNKAVAVKMAKFKIKHLFLYKMRVILISDITFQFQFAIKVIFRVFSRKL